jgi:hypothetical protein
MQPPGAFISLLEKALLMKPRQLLLRTCCALLILVVCTSAMIATRIVVDSNGKLGNAGSPGEFTCSEAGCHGAGDGNSTTGGLPDNGGPGSITLTTNPAFAAGNQYVPGTTYSVTITVSETGKSLFGFSFEALDNSGSTNTSVNNAVGTVTITDGVHTRVGQPFGTGRVAVTHQAHGGAFANSATFNFNWTAPASGIVNLYYDGNADNGDGLADAQDNVYSHTLQISPAPATGIAPLTEPALALEVFPNPANDLFTVRFRMSISHTIDLRLYSLEGKFIKILSSKEAGAGLFSESYSTKGLAKGFYLIKIVSNGVTATQRLMVN